MGTPFSYFLKFLALVKAVIIICALTIFLFIFIEIIVRTFTQDIEHPGHLAVNDQNHVPKPYVFSVANPQAPNINLHGYKSEDPEKYMDKQTVRIFVVGGSTVFNGDPPFSTYLQEIINEKLPRLKVNGKRCVVFNYGVLSSVIYQDLARILYDIVQYQPHLVIMYGGGNDLISSPDSRAGYPHRFRFYENSILWNTNIKNYPLIPLILFGSLILRKLLKQFFTKVFLKKEYFYGGNFKKYHHLQTYHDAIFKSVKLAEAFNFKLLVILQPLLAAKKKILQKEIEKAHFKKEQIPEQKTIEDFNRSETAKFIRTISSKNFFYQDLKSIFDGTQEPVFTDFIHINQPAKKFLAYQIFKIIETRNILGN